MHIIIFSQLIIVKLFSGLDNDDAKSMNQCIGRYHSIIPILIQFLCVCFFSLSNILINYPFPITSMLLAFPN